MTFDGDAGFQYELLPNNVLRRSWLVKDVYDLTEELYIRPPASKAQGLRLSFTVLGYVNDKDEYHVLGNSFTVEPNCPVRIMTSTEIGVFKYKCTKDSSGGYTVSLIPLNKTNIRRLRACNIECSESFYPKQKEPDGIFESFPFSDRSTDWLSGNELRSDLIDIYIDGSATSSQVCINVKQSNAYYLQKGVGANQPPDIQGVGIFKLQRGSGTYRLQIKQFDVIFTQAFPTPNNKQLTINAARVVAGGYIDYKLRVV